MRCGYRGGHRQHRRRDGVIINVLGNDTFEQRACRPPATQRHGNRQGGPAVSVANGSVVLNVDGTITFRRGWTSPGAAAVGEHGLHLRRPLASVVRTANVHGHRDAGADAPRIDLDGITLGTSCGNTLDEGTAAIGRQVSVTDPENNNLASMTIAIEAPWRATC